MKLFSYWRSLASFRVRIALNLKGVGCDIETVDLLKGDQFDDAYLAVNPQPVVPALVDGGTVLFQSLAIVEYYRSAPGSRAKRRRCCRPTPAAAPGCAASPRSRARTPTR